VGYDLFKAREKFEQMRQFITEEIVGTKGNIPDVANNVRSDAIYHQPDDVNTMEGAKKAAAALFAAAE
jgi:hypothetical protein